MDPVWPVGAINRGEKAWDEEAWDASIFHHDKSAPYISIILVLPVGYRGVPTRPGY
jgi:hypothetical protein